MPSTLALSDEECTTYVCVTVTTEIFFFSSSRHESVRRNHAVSPSLIADGTESLAWREPNVHIERLTPWRRDAKPRTVVAVCRSLPARLLRCQRWRCPQQARVVVRVRSKFSWAPYTKQWVERKKPIAVQVVLVRYAREAWTEESALIFRDASKARFIHVWFERWRCEREEQEGIESQSRG